MREDALLGSDCSMEHGVVLVAAALAALEREGTGLQAVAGPEAAEAHVARGPGDGQALAGRQDAEAGALEQPVGGRRAARTARSGAAMGMD
jgi:hypothetical protein